jgi:MazG family protein
MAAAFARLGAIVARLRAPDGCPWDREQTHLSLRRHLIEEAYEVQEAIEAGDDAHLCEELGDLLLQPVLHAQIAAEGGRFDIAGVLDTLSDKLVRRHPHVFGEVQAQDTDAVLKNWEAIKQQEKAGRGEVPGAVSLLNDVPAALPALMLALEVSRKAARAGFEWPDLPSVLDKLHEEVAELEEALEDSGSTPERVAEELGDLLFTVVNVARWRKIDPELALRDMVSRFRARFAAMEATAQRNGEELSRLTPERWDELWREAKAGPQK